MIVKIFSGSLPPDVCGVGDYTENLTRSLNDLGFRADSIKLDSKNLWDILIDDRSDIKHIQYPSKGFGCSLIPHILSFFIRPVVTIHEYSHAGFLRKMAEIPLFVFSKKIIVTTDHEKNEISKLYSGFNKKISVIPVMPSFLPIDGEEKNSNRAGLVFFGLMRKEKGVEEFISLCFKLNKKIPNMPIKIYSAIPDDCYSFFEEIKEISKELNIEWQINKPLSEVSRGLVKSKYAYLHFPDGVSARRSSFIAALSHGVLVLSNSGLMTPPNLKFGFVDVSSSNDAFYEILNIESGDSDYEVLREKGLNASKAYSPENIALKHIELYRELKG